MSVVTHVIPAQSFTDGQIINIVTPTLSQSQDLVTQTSTVVPLALTSAVHVETKVDVEQEKQKQAIYNHPLFPLMVLMFERCEQASGTADFSGTEGLDSDIHAFIQHQEKEKKSFYSNNTELDQLMIKSIQVLRIHLLELEKVTELCKDFCTRYTNCLKGKLQSENLLRTESDYDQSMFDEPPPETSSSVPQVHGIPTSATSNVILGQPFHSTVSAMPTLNPGQIMSGGTVYQMVQTPQGLVAQPIQIQTSMASLATPMIHGGTPISQIGVPAASTSTGNSTSGITSNNLGSAGSGFDSDDDDSGKKRTKRGVLPKSATQVMKSWLFQHIVHPYPTEDEKRLIASQTNLTLLQVNNWFINARRRILQPMLDAGNPDTSKAKKTKPQSKPPQRFWPFSNNGGDKATTSSTPESVGSTATTPSIAGLGQTIVLPPGAFVTPDGQIVNLQGSNMATMLTQVKSSMSPPTSPDKDSSDNNNNSHNTDNDQSESEGLT